MFPEVTKALASEGIVGAPWPSASWSPSVILKLSWPNAEAQLGNLLPSSLVQEQPTVSFNSEPGVIYTVSSRSRVPFALADDGSVGRSCLWTRTHRLARRLNMDC